MTDVGGCRLDHGGGIHRLIDVLATFAVLLVLLALPLRSALADRQHPNSHRGVDPDVLVKPDGTSVANGCGPGWSSWFDAASWRLANRHTYQVGGSGYCQKSGSCDGETWTYEVDFRDACNLHDVGYAGKVGVMIDGKWVERRLVYDRILDVDVDYSRWSREQVDGRFYEDMVASCVQQLVQQEGRAPYAGRARSRALDACEHSGQGSAIGGSWGAETMLRMVRAYGDTKFDELGGARVNDKIRTGR